MTWVVRIREELAEPEEERLRRPFDDRGKKVVATLLEKDEKCAMDNGRTTFYNFMDRATVKTVFIGGVYDLREETIYTFAEPQGFRE